MSLTVMPLIYTTDVDQAIGFFEALGLKLRRRSRPGEWAELDANTGALALHGTESVTGDGAAERIELVLEAHAPLEQIADRLAAAGYPPREGIVDEAFGRSLGVHAPDGLRVQINESDPSLYT